MTYIQLINKIVQRLRNYGVLTDLSEDYTGLVGSFVNQAKEEIEDEGPWQALRTEVTVTTVASTATASVGGTNERSYVHYDPDGCAQVFETTSGFRGRMNVITPEQMRTLRASDQNPTNAHPSYVSFAKTNAGLTATFYPTPNGVYTYTVVAVIPQAELTAVATVITIPARPVWMLALAYALKERGEELGSDYETVRGEAAKALRDAKLTDYEGESRTFYAD